MWSHFEVTQCWVASQTKWTGRHFLDQCFSPCCQLVMHLFAYLLTAKKHRRFSRWHSWRHKRSCYHIQWTAITHTWWWDGSISSTVYSLVFKCHLEYFYHCSVSLRWAFKHWSNRIIYWKFSITPACYAVKIWLAVGNSVKITVSCLSINVGNDEKASLHINITYSEISIKRI